MQHNSQSHRQRALLSVVSVFRSQRLPRGKCERTSLRQIVSFASNTSSVVFDQEVDLNDDSILNANHLDQVGWCLECSKFLCSLWEKIKSYTIRALVIII